MTAPVPALTASPGFVAWLKAHETGATPAGRLLPRGRPALKAYLCPAGKWTIGWGSTGPDIGRGTVWTLWMCEVRFARDLARIETRVRRLVGTAPTTPGQVEAMIALAYNIGVEALATSTLLKRHLASDVNRAAAEFGRWVHARVDGHLVVLRGLVERRAEEAAMYRGAPSWPS